MTTFNPNAVAAALAEAPAGDGRPVIFYGLNPRYIGHAYTAPEVDALLIAQHLSATYVSRAAIQGRDGVFFIAHG